MNKCPECGRTIQIMAGVTLKAFPFCKADFSPYINGEKPLPNAAPGAPAAPAAPGARGPPRRARHYLRIDNDHIRVMRQQQITVKLTGIGINN